MCRDEFEYIIKSRCAHLYLCVPFAIHSFARTTYCRSHLPPSCRKQQASQVSAFCHFCRRIHRSKWRKEQSPRRLAYAIRAGPSSNTVERRTAGLRVQSSSSPQFSPIIHHQRRNRKRAHNVLCDGAQQRVQGFGRGFVCFKEVSVVATLVACPSASPSSCSWCCSTSTCDSTLRRLGIFGFVGSGRGRCWRRVCGRWFWFRFGGGRHRERRMDVFSL